VGTKFVWPSPGPKFQPVALTPEKEQHWKKWIDLYNQKMLSKGKFLDLYVTGYDVPEGYTIEKDGKMYYAFFTADPAKSWQGDLSPARRSEAPRLWSLSAGFPSTSSGL